MPISNEFEMAAAASEVAFRYIRASVLSAASAISPYGSRQMMLKFF